MLRKFLDYQLSLVENGKRLHRLRPLVSAADTFLYEAPINTKTSPHIRDAIDVKRWMVLVIIALIPTILMAIWNTGVQKFVYASGNYKLMEEFLSIHSFQQYIDFVSKDTRWLTMISYGAAAFIPVMLISYAVGGLWEALFALIRRHEIAEGFLVTGMLYPLVLPPTIPYWMVAVGVSVGVVLGKEVFGGTGMNILNPALVCRAFLFFTFPGKMSGDVWVGTNPTHIRESLNIMNAESGRPAIDGFTQASALAKFNIADDVKRIHVDAIASNSLGREVSTIGTVDAKLQAWNSATDHHATLGKLTSDEMRAFVTTPAIEGGLGLSSDQYQSAYEYAQLKYAVGAHTNGNFFFGNIIGSMGETSVLACLLGAFFLIYTGIGAWRTMAAMALGAFLTAWLFETGSHLFGADGGAWNPAKFDFPAYKHLLLGGMAFGLVFMATDPVSSPADNLGKWFYGLLIGIVALVIRGINPAYPEGVMLAILIANVFAPLIDYYCVRYYRRKAVSGRV